MELIADINWLASIVLAVIVFIGGWIWYHPKVFGKKWAAANSLKEKDMDVGGVKSMVLIGLGTLLMSIFIGVLYQQVYVYASVLVLYVLMTIVSIWSMVVFMKRDKALIWIDGGYIALSTLIIGYGYTLPFLN